MFQGGSSVPPPDEEPPVSNSDTGDFEATIPNPGAGGGYTYQTGTAIYQEEPSGSGSSHVFRFKDFDSDTLITLTVPPRWIEDGDGGCPMGRVGCTLELDPRDGSAIYRSTTQGFFYFYSTAEREISGRTASFMKLEAIEGQTTEPQRISVSLDFRAVRR